MKIILLLSLLLLGCGHSSTPKATKTTAPTTYISTQPIRGIAYDVALNKVAFSSCANQDQPQPLWRDIEAMKPDLFLFMGDNVYASHPLQKPIADQYRKLDLIPEFQSIRQKVPFMATWDDHDYGLQDGGADWSGKDEARRDFLNFWTYVKNSIPLEQQGIYHSKTIGPKKKSVQVIMLDTRYFRSPLKGSTSNNAKIPKYIPDDEGTVLGDAQWMWLEAQLKKPANIRFVVSSIQLIPDEPPFEKWGNFPKERQRFFDLLKKTKAKNVIILSGDRHIASISKIDLKNYGPLYEITASSINRANNYSDGDSHYVGPVYNKENFGLAHIDWNKKIVNVDILGAENKVVNSVQIKLH